jgi:hypothetical protein
MESSEDLNKRFGRIKAGYRPVKSSITPKPTTGNLLYKGEVIKEDQPFPILQTLKKELIRSGCSRKDFKIEYYYPKK